MNEKCTSVMCNMCSVRCGVAARTLSRVRERSHAACRRERRATRAAACLRATAARAAARAPTAPRARHAPPAPAHTAAPPHAELPPESEPAAGSRTTRLSMCSVRCVARSRDRGARHAPPAGQGGWSCALRHASVSTLSCVLPQPAICRDVLAGLASSARARATLSLRRC